MWQMYSLVSKAAWTMKNWQKISVEIYLEQKDKSQVETL